MALYAWVMGAQMSQVPIRIVQVYTSALLEGFHLVKRYINVCADQILKNLDVSRKYAVLTLCFASDIPQKLFESLQHGLYKTFWHFQNVKGIAPESGT